MKKTLVIIVSAVLVVSLWGCGESTPAGDADSTIIPAVEGAGDAADKAVTDAKKAADQK
jgi:hypothetical protein